MPGSRNMTTSGRGNGGGPSDGDVGGVLGKEVIDDQPRRHWPAELKGGGGGVEGHCRGSSPNVNLEVNAHIRPRTPGAPMPSNPVRWECRGESPPRTRALGRRP